MTKCTCKYVPPHVLSAIARHPDYENPSWGKQINQGQWARELRVARSKHPQIRLNNIKPPNGSLLVYDSKGTYEQRKVLVWGNANGPVRNQDPIAALVFAHARSIKEYMWTHMVRDGIDGNSSNFVMNIHFGDAYGNAFWDGDEMTFGDGDGKIFGNFAKSLDVTAHEMGHGLVQHTANLEYQGQSGALNEHFADVFGTTVVQSARTTLLDSQEVREWKADWLIGDEIMGPTLFGEALRSMKAPGQAYDNRLLGKDPQPSHMRDYYDGKQDNGGVHINSGILNKVFYLVASDIGTNDAFMLWWEALKSMWHNIDFLEAKDVLVNTSRRMNKEGDLWDGATQTVRLAFKEVGL